MIDPEIADLLNAEATRINRPEFIGNDPVQFPRRFSKLQDIEITSFLSAIIAWGKRTMICRDADRMLSLMDNEPYNYVMDKGYEDLNPEMNIHRTFFANHFQYFLRGLHKIYKDYSSLDEFAASLRLGNSTAPAWDLVDALEKLMTEENGGYDSP